MVEKKNPAALSETEQRRQTGCDWWIGAVIPQITLFLTFALFLLRFTTKHLNDESTPKNIRTMLQ